MCIPCDKHSNDQTQTEMNARLCAHCTYLNTELNFFYSYLSFNFEFWLTLAYILPLACIQGKKEMAIDHANSSKNQTIRFQFVYFSFVFSLPRQIHILSEYTTYLVQFGRTKKKENEYKNSNMKWIEIWNKVKVCRLSLYICTWIIYGFFMGSN